MIIIDGLMMMMMVMVVVVLLHLAGIVGTLLTHVDLVIRMSKLMKKR